MTRRVIYYLKGTGCMLVILTIIIFAKFSTVGGLFEAANYTPSYTLYFNKYNLYVFIRKLKERYIHTYIRLKI